MPQRIMSDGSCGMAVESKGGGGEREGVRVFAGSELQLKIRYHTLTLCAVFALFSFFPLPFGLSGRCHRSGRGALSFFSGSHRIGCGGSKGGGGGGH